MQTHLYTRQKVVWADSGQYHITWDTTNHVTGSPTRLHIVELIAEHVQVFLPERVMSAFVAIKDDDG